MRADKTILSPLNNPIEGIADHKIQLRVFRYINRKLQMSFRRRDGHAAVDRVLQKIAEDQRQIHLADGQRFRQADHAFCPNLPLPRQIDIVAQHSVDRRLRAKGKLLLPKCRDSFIFFQKPADPVIVTSLAKLLHSADDVLVVMPHLPRAVQIGPQCPVLLCLQLQYEILFVDFDFFQRRAQHLIKDQLQKHKQEQAQERRGYQCDPDLAGMQHLVARRYQQRIADRDRRRWDPRVSPDFFTLGVFRDPDKIFM